MTNESGSDSDDQWQARYEAAIYNFGRLLQDLDRNNPWLDLPVLPKALSYLLTELWDNGYSKSEIKLAINEALMGLEKYTAGDDIRY